MKVSIDGASRGIPGPASVGIVFKHATGHVVKKKGSRIGVTTNNVAEYTALVLALQEALMDGVQDLHVFTDSELLAKQFNGDYKVKEQSLKLLLLFAKHLKQGFKKLTVAHIPREQNKLADEEANRALDQEFFL
jgi:ribonuclease HI